MYACVKYKALRLTTAKTPSQMIVTLSLYEHSPDRTLMLSGKRRVKGTQVVD